MKLRVTLDTNVLVVANRQNSDVTDDCLLAARECVSMVAQHGTIFIDQDGAILQEYGGQIDAEARPQDISARLLIWLRQSRFSDRRIQLVDVKRANDDEYVNCPLSLIEAGFDFSDRKFVAVAHKAKVTIVNATDSDWIDHADLLQKEGVKVYNLCGCDKAVWFR